MGRLEWSGKTRKGGGRRGGTLKLGKGSGTGVVVPSEQYSTREGGGGTSCTDVITWQGGKAAQVGGGRETGLEVRVEEEDGRSEDRDREAEAGGEKKSKPGGGKADKGREER